MIEHLFGSRTRLKLLQIFLAHPEKYYYVRELARMSGAQLNAVRREIANLQRVGLVAQIKPVRTDDDSEIKNERSKYYHLLSDSLLYPELRDLLVKVQMLEEREFVRELKNRGGKIKFMMLSGIFTDSKDVETDLLLVGQVRPQAVDKLIRQFEKTINREIRYTIMSEKEFNERREIGDKFLYGLFEAKHSVPVDEFYLTK